MAPEFIFAVLWKFLKIKTIFKADNYSWVFSVRNYSTGSPRQFFNLSMIAKFEKRTYVNVCLVALCPVPSYHICSTATTTAHPKKKWVVRL